MSDSSTLFEIDRELDSLLDEIEEQTDENGSASSELLARFQKFCDVASDKVDRIGRFLTLMDSRMKYCRAEADRLQKRARSANAKIERTQNMVLYFLAARGLKKIEGREFTLRQQKNSQDSVHITDGSQLPMFCRELDLRIPGPMWEEVLAFLPEETSNALKVCVRDERPSNEAIKLAVSRSEEVPGAEVKRGNHLRVA
jgi:Siphovirus Gp157